MRSLLDKKDNSKRNQLILGIGLIIIMVFSTMGYALSGRDNKNNEKINYKNIEFIKDNSGYWRFNINGNEFLTKYNPLEIQDIKFKGNLKLLDLQDKPLYFAGDSNEPFIEIARNIEKFVLRMQNACVSEEDCEGDLPIKNCFKDNVIVIKEAEGNETIYQQGNCIFIKADFVNQTKYVDKFIYDLLEV